MATAVCLVVAALEEVYELTVYSVCAPVCVYKSEMAEEWYVVPCGDDAIRCVARGVETGAVGCDYVVDLCVACRTAEEMSYPWWYGSPCAVVVAGWYY